MSTDDTGGVPAPWTRAAVPAPGHPDRSATGTTASSTAGPAAGHAAGSPEGSATGSTVDSPAGPPAGGPAESGTGPAARSPAGPGPTEEWRRLPALMLVVAPATALLKFAPALIVLVLFGAGNGNAVQMWIALAVAVLAVATGVIRWRTTRYRVTDDRVELHSGLLNRQRRSVPRDRIRTVDLTAPLLHRLVGLSVVKVGSGQSAGKESGLDLDAVTAAEADRLRRELLNRPAAEAVPDDPAAPEDTTAGAEEIDRLDWSSLRYAPLTIGSLAAVGAAFGAGWNFLNEADVDPRTLPGADAVADELSTAPIWASVLVAIVVLLVVMVAGSVVLFIERWWNYRLTRESDGTLRVARGLLTRRSLSVSEQRLRGVTVTEPILVRALGRGAQAGALTVGLADDKNDAHSGSLGPPVHRAHAHRVAAIAARADDDITTGPLTPHPRRARIRRLTRAVVPALVFPAAALVLWYLGGPTWPIVIAVVLVVLAVPLGLDRYRALGHRLDERYLVARSGSLLRTTTALRRDGVIGWRIRQSWFQQRAGLVTLEATTAAGSGSVHVLDLSADDAVALVAEVTPDPVAGFRP